MEKSTQTVIAIEKHLDIEPHNYNNNDNYNLTILQKFIKTHSTPKSFKKYSDARILMKIKSLAFKSITQMLNDYFIKLSNLKKLKNPSHVLVSNCSRKFNRLLL